MCKLNMFQKKKPKFTNPWRSKKEKHKGMFFIIPTIFSSTNCCKQMKNRFSRILLPKLPNCSLPNWFCRIENHTCSNCENGSFLSYNILFQSHLQRIAPTFLNLSPLFPFQTLKNKLCHLNYKTQLQYLLFLLIEILQSFNIDDTVLKKNCYICPIRCKHSSQKFEG